MRRLPGGVPLSRRRDCAPEACQCSTGLPSAGEPVGAGINSLDIVSGWHLGERRSWSLIMAGLKTLRIQRSISSFFCLMGTSKLTFSASQRSQLYLHVMVSIAVSTFTDLGLHDEP